MTASVVIQGLKGTGAFTNDERPKSWREKVLELFPNGDVSLNAILSMVRKEPVTDYEYYWWTKALPGQGGTVTNVYTDPGMATAYTTGGAAGDLLYVKCGVAVAREIRAGHQVLLRNTSNYLDDTVAKVVATLQNGDSSRITVKLLQADPTTTGLADCNNILVIGNINPQGGEMPQAIAYPDTKLYNYTQIFRTALSLTRTLRKTKLRTGDEYARRKIETLRLHNMEMEKALFWSIKTENTGDNGEPETTTHGIIPFIKDNGGQVSNYVTDEDFDGKAWVTGGADWIDKHLAEAFKYGSEERLGFCGMGVITAIQKLVKNGSTYNIYNGEAQYGIKVKVWETPFGVLYLKTHPLFSYNTVNNLSLVAFEPQNLIYRYIDDTQFFSAEEKKVSAGGRRLDGTQEEYLTEMGLEFHHPSTALYLNGFGSANPE